MTRASRNLGSIGLALLFAGAAVVIAADSPTTTSPATTTATAAPSASPAPTTTASATLSSPSIASRTPATPGSSGVASSGARSTARENYSERYDVLADRNIFVKERWKIVKQSERDNPPRRNTSRDVVRSSPPPEVSYILTGIVLEDGLVHAYVEDMKGGKVLRLSVGDPVARGQITDISIDAVQYSASGQQVWVDLGRDFTGAIPSSPSAIYAAAAAAGATTTGSSSTTGPSSAPAAAALPLDPNNPNLSMEERMKIRRMQQLGGGANK